MDFAETEMVHVDMLIMSMSNKAYQDGSKRTIQVLFKMKKHYLV